MKKTPIKILCAAVIVIMLTINTPAARDVTLNVITGPRVPTFSVQYMLSVFTAIPSYNVHVVTAAYSAEKYPDLAVLPAYFFSQELADEKAVFNILQKNRMVTENRKTFGKIMYEVDQSSYGPGLYLKNKQIKGQMEFFYRPFCPYGTKALIALLEYRIKVPAAFSKIVLTPMVEEKTVSGSKKALTLIERFDIAEGLPELREVVHQMVISEYYPDQLLQYLKYLQSEQDWQQAAKKAGLDINHIREISDLKEEEMLRQSATRYSKYEAKYSPTYLWENTRRYNYSSELLQEPELKNIKIDFGNSKCQ
ncbi:MAG: hypothetical protein ABIH39_08995 [Candidatus Margulisiibacteriota bacterium]